jgi:hypothetical protein
MVTRFSTKCVFRSPRSLNFSLTRSDYEELKQGRIPLIYPFSGPVISISPSSLFHFNVTSAECCARELSRKLIQERKETNTRSAVLNLDLSDRAKALCNSDSKHRTDAKRNFESPSRWRLRSGWLLEEGPRMWVPKFNRRWISTDFERIQQFATNLPRPNLAIHANTMRPGREKR